MLSKFERKLLKKFRNKVDKFKHTLCPTCNESFLSIVLVEGECQRCYSEKSSKNSSSENNIDLDEVPDEVPDEMPDKSQNQIKKTKLPKKFSSENNMDPGEVLDELQREFFL